MTEIITNQNKIFSKPKLDEAGKLRVNRAATELKALHKQAQHLILLKTLVAVVALVISVAIVALFPASISFLGFGIGLAILSIYAIRDCHLQWKRINSLFQTAKAALIQN
jgi:hypothetical protein